MSLNLNPKSVAQVSYLPEKRDMPALSLQLHRAPVVRVSYSPNPRKYQLKLQVKKYSTVFNPPKKGRTRSQIFLVK